MLMAGDSELLGWLGGASPVEQCRSQELSFVIVERDGNGFGVHANILPVLCNVRSSAERARTVRGKIRAKRNNAADACDQARAIRSGSIRSAGQAVLAESTNQTDVSKP
jgi:hypothetical protein